ncbi:ras-related protein Rab-34 isoform X3 [Peromyscus leucopus]|uniref:ras-related protein Rab-34 isoform X3 n=1 Tax=Peromyscus leucopus TaxID=10041 RepID=UPI001884A5A0|nr:ras-related protein Rab-34 isoform X3 [Peromyscus leucopus]
MFQAWSRGGKRRLSLGPFSPPFLGLARCCATGTGSPSPVPLGSPRPGVIVSSPWPAVVVASPRPRAPAGSPWPRVIVGTPRPRVIVGSPRARAAGADQASAPSRGAPQGRRQDEHPGARAEGPRPGGAAPDLRYPRSSLWETCPWGRPVSLIGSAKTPLTKITRPPSGWILRWSDLKCWVSPSVSNFGTLLGRRGSNASLPLTTGEPKPWSCFCPSFSHHHRLQSE